MTLILDPYNLAGSGKKLMRQSMLGQYKVCPQRLDFDRRHGGGASEPRIVGTAYHAGVAQFYEHQFDETFPDMGAVLNAVDKAFNDEVKLAHERGYVFGWDKFGSETQALNGARTMATQYVTHHRAKPTDFEVLGVEVPFWWPLSDDWMAHGTIDLVLRDKRDGTHWLRDHKTAGRTWKKGKESARANAQPAWYLAFWPHLWAATHNGELPICQFGFEVMEYTGRYEFRPAPRTLVHIANAFADATEIAQLLDSETTVWFKNTEHFLCDKRWCDHFSRCPKGEMFDNPRSH